MKFKKNKLFRNSKSKIPIEENTELKIELPQQMGNHSNFERGIVEEMQRDTIIAVTGAWVIENLIQGTFNEIWLFVNQLQLIVLLPLVNVPMPALVKNLFNVMMKAAAFDYFDTDALYMEILQVPETPSLSTNFSLSGFE